MPRFEFNDAKTGFKYVTFTPNLDIALRNAKSYGFTEDQLIAPKKEAPHVSKP